MLQVNVEQDAAVAAAHHQQGEHVERREVEHVVGGLLPVAGEAAVGGALGEVGLLHPDCPEDEELKGAKWAESGHVTQRRCERGLSRREVQQQEVLTANLEHIPAGI